MKSCFLVVLTLFCLNTAWADFSEARFQTHPVQPALRGNGVYLIEVTGEWPTDCHPGEQKPVVREYTGSTAIVEFETIVEHVTCHDVATPYRVLVDMSDVIDSAAPKFQGIEVTFRFGETEFTKNLSLLCICSPSPVGPDINPEPGLYESEGLDKQGIIVARQNDRMGVYPLIYDEAGSSEWLIGAGGIVEDVFFASLDEFTGGQCLDCLPPDDPPQMNAVGKLTMLMDSEGVIQVKVNDGLFEEYKPLVYGYGELKIGGNPRVSVADLSGRWAFSESDTNGSITPTDVLPLVFDVVLESVFFMMPPITLEPPTPPGEAIFLIQNLESEEVTRMKCTNFFSSPDQTYDESLKWTCIIPEQEADGEIGLDNQMFSVELLSPERMKIHYSGLVHGVGGRSQGIAVRID